MRCFEAACARVAARGSERVIEKRHYEHSGKAVTKSSRFERTVLHRTVIEMRVKNQIPVCSKLATRQVFDVSSGSPGRDILFVVSGAAFPRELS